MKADSKNQAWRLSRADRSGDSSICEGQTLIDKPGRCCIMTKCWYTGILREGSCRNSGKGEAYRLSVEEYV